MATNTTTIKFTGQFDTSQITKGLQDIKKQITSSNISEELKKQLQESFSKVEVNLPKLDKFMKKEDFNLKELAEYQKLVQEITKDMTNFSKVANEADFTKNLSEQDTARLKKFDEQIKQVDNKLKTTKEEIIKTFSSSDKGKIGGKSNNTLNGFIEQLISVPPDKIEEKLDEVIKDAETQADQAVDRLQTIFKNKATGHKGGKGFIELLFGENSGVSLKEGKTLGDPKAGGKGAYSIFNDIREQVLKLEKDAGPDKINPIIEAYSNFIKEFFNVPEDKQSVLSGLVTSEMVERLKEFKGPEGIEGLKQALGEGNLKFLADGEAEKLRLTQEQAAELKKTIEGLAQEGVITREQAEDLIKKFTGLSGAINDTTEAGKRLDNQEKALAATFGTLAKRITNSISALTVFNKATQIVHKAIASVKELDAAFTQIAIVSGQTNEQAWQMFESFNKLAKQYSITTKDLTEGAKLFYQQGLSEADTMKMVEASTVSAALGEVTMAEAANTLTAAIQGYNESAAVAMDYTDKIAMVGAVSAADFNELSTAMEKTASSAYTAGIDFDHLLGYLGKMIEVTREAPANLGTAMKTIIARFEDMKKDPNAIIDGASANKVESALATIGIALRDTAGEFRPLQDVIDELGGKWNSLTRNQQAYIATVAAGSRQQSRFLAMMNNFDRTMDLVAESQNSAGAAAQQYATYQDSAAAATARLTAAWEEFYAKIVNSEQIIWIIDRLKDLIEIMSEVGPVVSAIGASLAALSGQIIIKGITSSFTKSLATAATTGKALSISLSGIVSGAGALVVTLGKLVLILGAVVAAIWAGVKAWQAWDKHSNPDKYRVKELTKDVKDLNESISESSEKAKTLEDLMKRYEELNKKIYRTKEEQEELNDTISKINDISKRAIISIKENGDAHLYNADSVKQEIEAEKELVKYKADQKYKKVNQLLQQAEKGNVSADQAREAGLQILADSLEQSEDEEYKRYQQYRDNLTIDRTSYKNREDEEYEDRLQRQNLELAYLSNRINDEDFSKIFDDIEDFKYFLEEVKGYTNLDDIKNKEDLQDLVNGNSNILKGRTTADRAQEMNELIEEFYESSITDSTKQAVEYLENQTKQADDINKQANENLKNLAADYASTGDEAYSALFSLMEDGLTFTEDQLKELDWEQFYGKHGKAVQEYLESDKTQEDIDKLINAVQGAQQAVTDGLTGYAEKAKEAAEKAAQDRKNQRMQFWQDNLSNIPNEIRKKYLQQGRTEGKSASEVFSENENISSLDLASLETAFKLNISEDSKIKLFNSIIADEDDEFQKLGEKYIKSLANGVTNESDKIREELKTELISIMGLSEEDAEKYLDDLVPNYKELLEERIDEDLSNYNTTRKGAADLSTLKSKERKQFLAENEDADKYFEYNEDGEEYLNILGKIVLLEQQRSKIITDINEKISLSKIEIQDNEKSITEILADQSKSKEEQEATVKYLEEQNANLQESITLYEKQKEYIEQTTTLHEYESMALQSNVNEAKKHADNIEAIAKAWSEYQKGTKQSNLEAISTLNQLDASYQSLFMTVSENGQMSLNLNQEIVDQMVANEQREYQEWREKEVQKLEDEKTVLEGRAQALELWLQTGEWTYNTDAENKEAAARIGAEGQVDAENQGYQKGLDNSFKFYSSMEKIAQDYFTDVSQWAKDVYSNLNNPDAIKLSASKLQLPTLEIDAKVDFNDFDPSNPDDPKNRELAQKLLEQYKQRIAIITATIAKLGDLSPELQKTYEDAITNAAKAGKDAMEDLNKIIEDTAKAVENLDKLLQDLPGKLKDIKFNYNPFTQIFEEWEHEWDYFFNINRLRNEIDTKGSFIENTLSNEFTSSKDYLKALKAKSGNIQAKMGANDTYITALRAGMSKTAVELGAYYGDYYRVDPDTMQVYQNDKALQNINNLINERKKELYDLQKVANTNDNDLQLQEKKLDLLEEQKSAYEDILDEIQGQIDSLKDKENVEADISDLEAEKATIKTQIELTDSSIDEVKDTIDGMTNKNQDIKVQIELKQSEVDKLEGYVDDMNSKLEEYQQYWENLNGTIAEQQELLQSLVDNYRVYKDTAISMEQELYDAIVENYQKEINEKKKQYDYLKQLDNDYLNTIKENIDKERKAREDTNKQKDYQKNLQRAQLLQMDTSGAHRNELADLNKEIENQRQNLYDDLVDKQVEALEKEIEKRHELYDREVQALEERLAYMQENAALLWESVNEIIAQGTDAMMATLEQTTDYINANELTREDQRNQWEKQAIVTYEAIQDNELEALKYMIESGQKMLGENYPEIEEAIDEFGLEFEKAKAVWEASQVALQVYNDMIAKGATDQEAANAAMAASALKLAESLVDTSGLFEKDIIEVANAWGVDLTALNGLFSKENLAILEGMGVDVEALLGNWGTTFEGLAAAFGINLNSDLDDFGNKLGDTAGGYNSAVIGASKEFVDALGSEGLAGAIGAVEDFLNTDKEEFIANSGNIFSSGASYFQGIMDSFMGTWNSRTHEFTGYAEDWQKVTGSLKEQTELNMAALGALTEVLLGHNDTLDYEEGRLIAEILGLGEDWEWILGENIGSIENYDSQIRDINDGIYNDYIAERERYQDELNTLIEKIQDEITAAIEGAANAIQAAADSISFSGGGDTGGGDTGGGDTGGGNPGGNSNPKKYNIIGSYNYVNEYGESRQGTQTLKGYETEEKAYKALVAYLEAMLRSNRWKSYSISDVQYNAYAQGGLATSTGLAWLDGTKSKPERVLSPEQTQAFDTLLNVLTSIEKKPAVEKTQVLLNDNQLDKLLNMIYSLDENLISIIQFIMHFSEENKIYNEMIIDYLSSILKQIDLIRYHITEEYRERENFGGEITTDFREEDVKTSEYQRSFYRDFPKYTYMWYDNIINMLNYLQINSNYFFESLYEHLSKMINETTFEIRKQGQEIEHLLFSISEIYSFYFKENNINITNISNILSNIQNYLLNSQSYLDNVFKKIEDQITTQPIKDNSRKEDLLFDVTPGWIQKEQELSRQLNIERLIDSIEKLRYNFDEKISSKPSYIIGDINTTIKVDRLDNNTDIDRIVRQVENKILNSVKNRVSVSIK